MKKIKISFNYVKRFVKWQLNNFYKKYEYKYMKYFYKIINILFLFALLILLFIFLKQLNIISINNLSNTNIVNIKINDIEYKEIHKDLVILQVSITFLTTAILSLISSLENKKILGEKTTTVLFGYKNSIYYISMLLLYIFMIFNIIFMLNETHVNILLILFVLSIYILIYIISKIGGIFLTTTKYRRLLIYKYYEDCKKNIIDIVPPRDYNSPRLYNLFNETLRLIFNKDTNYVAYINAYKFLIDRTLINLSQELQKYHLDMPYAKSIVNDFLEIIEHFIIVGEVDRAIQLYTWLLKKFNYYNVFIPCENADHIFNECINKITDLQNEYKTKEYISHITPIISYIQLQQYFALTNDFAYTNLSEMRLESIHFGDSMFFKNIYENLYTNKYLTDTEKRNCYFDLFDRFRMSGHNRNIYFFDDITNYHWEFKKTKEKKYPPCILGQATSSLLLSVLLNKDVHNFNLFSQMNIEQEEMEYAIHTMFLTLIKIEEEKQYENIYCDYYKLDIKWCKKFLHSKLEFLFNPKENSPYKTYSILKNINKSYNYITEVCNDNFETNKKYWFLGNHLNKYDIDMISIYFEKLSKIYKVKNVDIKNYKNSKLEKAIEKWLK